MDFFNLTVSIIVGYLVSRWLWRWFYYSEERRDVKRAKRRVLHAMEPKLREEAEAFEQYKREKRKYRQCFWSVPLGHIYDYPSRNMAVCKVCGKSKYVNEEEFGW